MDRGLYVHIPFCRKKCHYCDFTSYSGQAEDEQEAYLQALLQEARLYHSSFQDARRISTVYIGGGTPTCLSGGQLIMLISFLQELFGAPLKGELTIEGNPGTTDRKKLEMMIEAGCNRLSLGVQSFDPRDLRVLGRIHDPRDVYNTYQMARAAGFHNINLDLMYALPGQTLAGWQANLRAALSLEPEHLSLYQLNIERGTPFFRLWEKGLWEEPDQDLSYNMYREAIEILTARGYRHYEISNFARPGYESRHNRLYWENQEYVGLGAGAAGYLQGMRYTNLAVLSDYREQIRQGMFPRDKIELIDERTARAEMMFLGLRLLEGVDKGSFRRRFGRDIHDFYGEAIQKLTANGLLQESPTHLFLTTPGLFVANEVMMEFL